MASLKKVRQYARWRRFQIWLGLVALFGLVLCFVPLLDLLGYEFSLFLAVFASLGAGHIAAAYPDRVRQQLAPFPGARWTVVRLYLVVVGYGLLLLVAPLLFISLNALRVRNCDYVEGLGFYLLGPVFSVLVAAAWGLSSGLMTTRRRLASVLWILIWIAAFAFELYDGWSTPSVRAFGSFHGYFSGVLYDEAVVIPGELVTFRLRNLVEILALLAFCGWWIDRSELQLRLTAARTEKKRAPVVLFFSFWVVLGALFGPTLGHRRGAENVTEALGATTTFERCVIHHSSTLGQELSQLIARDCAFRLHQVESYFGIEYQGQLTVFLFDDPDQKQELIGAGRTSVAKPWRREVYVQGARFPHPVLKHEIAHIVAGEFGANPLKVSGRLGGALVSPGLVEGAAVAAAWDEDELTPHVWSKAMRELDIAPPIERILGLNFFGLNASRAYVLAGSFSRYLIDTHGATKYRDAYRTTDLARAYGKSVDELEREWIAFLEKVDVSEDELALARNRFNRPAVFGKVCAHEVAQLRRRASDCESRGDWREAIEIRRLVERYSARDGRSRYELARTLLAASKNKRARPILQSIGEDDKAPQSYRRAAREIIADMDWAAGKRAQALQQYRELSKEPAYEPSRRLNTVKVAALVDAEIEPYLRRFFLGGETLGPEPPELALLTLAELVAERPEYAIGQYLLGRQLWNREHFERAIPYLEAADRRRLPTDELRAENRRLLAISHFRLGELERAESLFEALAEDDQRPTGVRATARDWIERCAWERERIADD